MHGIRSLWDFSFLKNISIYVIKYFKEWESSLKMKFIYASYVSYFPFPPSSSVYMNMHICMYMYVYITEGNLIQLCVQCQCVDRNSLQG
jgi:hypothetical protein